MKWMTLNFAQFTEETITALAQPTEQDILEAHGAAVTYLSKPFKNVLLTLPDDLEALPIETKEGET